MLKPSFEIHNFETAEGIQIIEDLQLRTGPDHLGRCDDIKREDHDTTSFRIITTKSIKHGYKYRYLAIWTNRETPSNEEIIDALKRYYEYDDLRIAHNGKEFTDEDE